MPRPTRLHPGFMIWTNSPQGRMFVEWLYYLLGDNLSWEPLVRTKDGSHVFHIQGSRAWGTLIEVQDRPEGELWVNEVGFRCDFPQYGGVVQLEFLSHSWDPWLYAEATGDRSIIEAPASRRRTITKEKSEQIGTARDTLNVKFVPLGVAPDRIAGLPVAAIDDARREHRVREDRRRQKAAPAQANHYQKHVN